MGASFFGVTAGGGARGVTAQAVTPDVVTVNETGASFNRGWGRGRRKNPRGKGFETLYGLERRRYFA
jgi:hypothetical protein